MRHQHKGFKLGRTATHRKATLAALSTALIKTDDKRIKTTHTKAKALRMFVEPIINRAKSDTTHNRRQAFRYLQDKDAVTVLFGDIASRIGDRPGGYTRIVKLGMRAGDAAQMAIIELVDYNDIKPEGASTGRKRKTTRRGRTKKAAAGAAAAVAATADVVDEVVDDVAEDVAEEVSEVVEEAAAAAEEAVTEAAEDVVDDVSDADAEDDESSEKKA